MADLFYDLTTNDQGLLFKIAERPLIMALQKKHQETMEHHKSEAERGARLRLLRITKADPRVDIRRRLRAAADEGKAESQAGTQASEKHQLQENSCIALGHVLHIQKRHLLRSLRAKKGTIGREDMSESSSRCAGTSFVEPRKNAALRQLHNQIAGPQHNNRSAEAADKECQQSQVAQHNCAESEAAMLVRLKCEREEQSARIYDQWCMYREDMAVRSLMEKAEKTHAELERHLKARREQQHLLLAADKKEKEEKMRRQAEEHRRLRIMQAQAEQEQLNEKSAQELIKAEMKERIAKWQSEKVAKEKELKLQAALKEREVSHTITVTLFPLTASVKIL